MADRLPFSGTDAPDDAPGRWRVLALLAVAELLGMAVWFAGSAASAELQRTWSLTGSETGWLTSAVQLGFVVGTLAAAVLNLPDLLPSRWYFAGCAALAAAANSSLLVAPSFPVGLVTRFLTGAFLAGVYPPAMKMASTWFRRGRGLAIGAIVGGLTVGKASPYLLGGRTTHSLASIVLPTSLGALIAAGVVALAYRDGPYAFPKRPFSWRLVRTVLGIREMRLTTGSYLGHMWELYCFWTWIAAFLAASLALSQGEPTAGMARPLAFLAIAIGAVGCVWGGRAADTLGRECVVTWALTTSGSCALLVGLAFGRSLWLLLPVVLVWGIAVIADSAQFSALVTESVPPHAVGTALTIQTSLGFLLTMATIQMIPPLVARIGWQWAFSVLAIGPAVGIGAIRRLKVLRRRA